MTSQIRPNRPEVSDRFPMLGFTIKTDGGNKRYEVAIASEASLFRPDAKPRRARANFYSSRAVGLQAIATGEAVYVLPPDVLARFVGQEKLYYALVTYVGSNGAKPEITALPTEASAYVNLRGLTGRSLQRIRVLPSRQRGMAGYGNGTGNELEWGGDVSLPGSKPIVGAPTESTVDSPGAASSNSTPVNYTDGYGPLPDSRPVPDAAGPSASAAPATAAQSFAGALGYEVQLIPQPDKKSCWAASMAMLVGYRRAVSITPESLAQEAGRSLRTSYGWDMLETVKNYFGFQEISLPSNASLYPSPEQWQNWLKAYGPLWVTTVGAPSHAIIVTGLSGDLTPNGTTISILNPWDTTTTFSADEVDFAPFNAGRAYTQCFADFAADFGNLGLDNYGNWRVLYLPNAVASEGQGVSYSSPSPRTRSTSDPNASHALTAESVDINWNEVELVPEIAGGSSAASALAMIIGWRDRICIDPATVASRATAADRRSLAEAWDLTIEGHGTYHVSEMQIMLARYGPLWAAGGDASDTHAFAIVGICGDGTPDNTIVCIKDPWGRAPGSPRAPQQNPTPGQGSVYTLSYRELARQYDPGGNTVAAEPHLQLIHSRSSDGHDAERLNCAVAPSLGLSAGPVQSRAQSDESFSINWDEVELIPQPNGVSCWATAGAMVIGWRDRVCITPETLADIAGRTTDRKLSPNERRQFAEKIGLSCEEPQSYSVEGFRNLLETYGPLWVSVQIGEGGHAIVVTGMYSGGADNGSDTYIRISDPWDRVVGSPGAAGDYLSTHNTGSRYILSWADFTREYEERASTAPDGRVNAQILHAAGTDGRQPGRSGGVGYAQAAASSNDSEEKLSPLPKDVARARAMDGGAVAVGAAIAGAVLERIANNQGDITWSLDQLRGLKHPNDIPPTPAPAFRDGPTIALDDGPWIENGFTDRITASFKIDWQFNGRSLGNVRIANTGTNDAVGWALSVEARIMDDNILYGPGTPGAAALRISFNHRFSRAIGSDRISITDLHLFGDGTFEKTTRWEQ